MPDVPLYQHWYDIYRRRWLIVLAGLIAACAAFVFSRMVTPVYEAKTTFFMAANAVSPSYVGPTPDAPPVPLFPIPEEKAASLDVGILRGREVMSRLAEQFSMPLGEMQRIMDVTVNGEFMVDVFVRSPDAAKAAAIANAVPATYAAFHEGSMKARAEAVAQALGGRKLALLADRAALEQRRLQSRKDSISTADAAALGRLEAARSEAAAALESLDAQIAQTEARGASLDASLRQEAQYYADALTMDTTPTLDGLLEKALELRVELSKVTFGPDSPRREAIEDQIRRIEDQMGAERRRLADAAAKPWGSLYEELRLEMALTRATLSGLGAARGAALSRLDAAEVRFDAALDSVADADEATVELVQIDRQIATVEENLGAAILQAANAKAPIVLVEAAAVPVRPVFPLPVLNASVAALCGVIFAAYYALFLAYRERADKVGRGQRAELPFFTEEELNRLRLSDTARLARDITGADHA